MAEKLAWPYKLDDVTRDLESRIAAAPDAATRDRLGRTLANLKWGRRYLWAGGAGAKTFGRGTALLGKGLNTLVSATSPLGGATLRGLGSVGGAVLRSPRTLGALGAGVALAPTLMSDVPARYDRVTERILRARQDPRGLVEERVVMASLDSFLEKKAGAPLTPGVLLRDSAIKGLATGAGSEVAGALMYGLSRAASGIGGALFGDPQKKAVLEKILATDQIISDALKRNPAVRDQIMEAYQTLQRFAPSLAADVNAVRSFLREVVLGGGHVNYATIKNLIDTEKSLHGDVPKYKGIF